MMMWKRRIVMMQNGNTVSDFIKLWLQSYAILQNCTTIDDDDDDDDDNGDDDDDDDDDDDNISFQEKPTSDWRNEDDLW